MIKCLSYIIFFSNLIIANVYDNNAIDSDMTIEKSGEDKSNAKTLNEIFIPTIAPNIQIKDLLDIYDNNEGVLDLKALLDYVKNNYTLQAKSIAIDESIATRASVYGRYAPSFDIGYNFNSTKNNSDNSINNHQLQASAKWIIFDGASREFSLLSNNALVRAAMADKGYSQELSFLQAIDLYYQYFSIKGQIIAMEQKKINISANVARVQVLFNAGLQTIDALEALKAELSATEYQVEELRLKFEQIKLQLSLISNHEVDKLKRISIPEPFYKENKSLNILMQEEQALSVEYKVGEITYWPTISLFDNYNWNFLKDSTLISPNFFSNYPKNQNIFGINVTWNIFSGFTTNRQKEALKLSNMRLQKNIAYAKEEQKNNIKLYKKAIETSLSQINSSEAALKSANISFDSVSRKYEAQLVSYTDYLDALIKKYDAESTYIKSLNNHELQKANYIFYSGQMFFDYVK